jgi:hypothetical protein
MEGDAGKGRRLGVSVADDVEVEREPTSAKEGEGLQQDGKALAPIPPVADEQQAE